MEAVENATICCGSATLGTMPVSLLVEQILILLHAHIPTNNHTVFRTGRVGVGGVIVVALLQKIIHHPPATVIVLHCLTNHVAKNQS